MEKNNGISDSRYKSRFFKKLAAWMGKHGAALTAVVLIAVSAILGCAEATILRLLENRQWILEIFFNFFSNSFTETWNDRQVGPDGKVFQKDKTKIIKKLDINEYLYPNLTASEKKVVKPGLQELAYKLMPEI